MAAGHERAQTWQDRAFWRTWVSWKPKPVPVVVMRPVHELPEDLRKLIMSFVPPEEPAPESPTFDVEQKASPWWQDPRMYGDF